LPHCLRHGGATYFVHVHGWALAKVQLRGRWLCMSSLRRYSKPHVLVGVLARLPENTRFWGRLFEHFPEKTLTRGAAGPWQLSNYEAIVISAE
jgi:hypothetical protein